MERKGGKSELKQKGVVHFIKQTESYRGTFCGNTEAVVTSVRELAWSQTGRVCNDLMTKGISADVMTKQQKK